MYIRSKALLYHVILSLNLQGIHKHNKLQKFYMSIREYNCLQVMVDITYYRQHDTTMSMVTQITVIPRYSRFRLSAIGFTIKYY